MAKKYSEYKDPDKFKEYGERHVRAIDIAINQFSRVNELLLGFTAVFLGFLLVERKDSLCNKLFYCCELNWEYATLLLSLIFSVISIIYGIALIINRLIDYRITRQITQVRKRYYKDFEEGLYTPKITKKIYFPLLTLLHYFLIDKPEKKFIEESEIKDWKTNKELINRFQELRNVMFILSKNSWRLISRQIIFFSLSFLVFGVNLTISVTNCKNEESTNPSRSNCDCIDR